MEIKSGGAREQAQVVRAIAFYLPQFHPTPENDAWWGTGFTEWRNVTNAVPRFPGQYQPHLPADLGFYDLRLPEVREAQAALARAYGVHGFAYYHYWFNGRRILERPFNEVLSSGQPDLPFCLCWANENWTRVWDGGEQNILLQQLYGDADDLAHIESLIPAFQDPRYIRVDDRPLFLVYRTELLPDPKRTAEIWRNAAQRAGLPGLYLVRVESFTRDVVPLDHGFDASVEFAPDGNFTGRRIFHSGLGGWLSQLGIVPRAFSRNRVVRYQDVATGMTSSPEPPFKRFRCATPMWDNSARRGENARILIGSSPARYERWLRTICAKTLAQFKGDERLVFINAWNEWAEGNHLEPDLKWGRAYLEATRRALTQGNVPGIAQLAGADLASTAPAMQQKRAYAKFKERYWGFRNWIAARFELVPHLFGRRR